MVPIHGTVAVAYVSFFVNLECWAFDSPSRFHPIRKLGPYSSPQLLHTCKPCAATKPTERLRSEHASALRAGDSDHIVTPRQRLDRTAADTSSLNELCILTIHESRYNVTGWAKRHPGGLGILQKYHDRNATEAFVKAGHSEAALRMLEQFDMTADSNTSTALLSEPKQVELAAAEIHNRRIHWRRKLFTKEDPIGLHKYAGIFVLLHFIYRYGQMIFGDPSCGFGSAASTTNGPSLVTPLCLIPHALLSLSSLIFHTVPRERIVGAPMIWQEFRVHNIIFGLRSVLTTFLAWISIFKHHAVPWRRGTVVSSCFVTLIAMWAADEATQRLRSNKMESTTATMPYWEGCSIPTQKRFKLFYAFSQFQATATCMAVGNPAWPLSILLPIQLASFLMTLVRKNLISPRAYHLVYSVSLALPYIVGLRSILYMKNLHFPLFLMASWLLFGLRRCGVNKYALWLPFALSRILFGDSLLQYDRPW